MVHFPVVLLRTIDHRWCFGLHRQIRGDQSIRLNSRPIFLAKRRSHCVCPGDNCGGLVYRLATTSRKTSFEVPVQHSCEWKAQTLSVRVEPEFATSGRARQITSH